VPDLQDLTDHLAKYMAEEIDKELMGYLDEM
jgi:hypothetical protein